MLNLDTQINLIVGDIVLSSWKSVSVRRSIDTICGSFSFQVGAADKTVFKYIVPQTLCIVRIGNDNLITGYIDSTDPEIDDDGSKITISGRCKTSDLVDCSAIFKTGQWKGKTSLLRVCKDLCSPFGITVTDISGKASQLDLSNISISTGESCFEIIQKLCKYKGVLPLSDSSGNLKLANSGEFNCSDTLEYGKNIKRVGASYTFSNRFKTYTIKGQQGSSGLGWSKSTIQINASSSDPIVVRYRPKVFVADGDMTTSVAKKYINWQAQTRAANSSILTLTHKGWKQSIGALWRENYLVVVNIPELDIISKQMLISSIQYTFDEASGQNSVMTLTRPDAFSPDPSEVVNKNKEVFGGWGTGGSETSSEVEEDITSE